VSGTSSVQAGASALSATNGRWLVWSGNANPFGGATPDVRSGLAYGFKPYGAAHGITPVAQATGNGFLFSLAPTITVGLTGSPAKVYDGTTGLTLLAGKFTAVGAVDGDVVTLNWTGSAFGDRNVGSGKLVTATGITASASNAGAPVYGHALASTTASANIGTITPAPLLIIADDKERPVDMSNPPFTASYVGLIGGDTPSSLSGTLGFSTPATVDSPEGSYLIKPFGQSSSNCEIAYVGGMLVVTGRPDVPGEAAGAAYSAQAVAAEYSRQAPPRLWLPAPVYVTGKHSPRDDESASTVRIVSGGLNDGRPSGPLPVDSCLISAFRRI
jgi:MBG domain (YGX type)/YDG domain